MALGFSIVKFAFLMIQPGSLSACKMALVPSKSYAGDFGIALVAAGLYSTCHAYYQYCFREKQRGKIRLGSTPLPALFLTAVVLVLGLFLFSELMQSV